MAACGEVKKRGPKIKWTQKRIAILCARIRDYARQAYLREGEVKGMNYVGPVLPTLSECFKKNRVSSSTVKDLAREHESLASALKKVKDVQEYILTNYALRGGYATTFAIFAAKNLLGWRDERSNIPMVDQSQHHHLTLVAPKERESVIEDRAKAIPV